MTPAIEAAAKDLAERTVPFEAPGENWPRMDEDERAYCRQSVERTVCVWLDARTTAATQDEYLTLTRELIQASKSGKSMRDIVLYFMFPPQVEAK